MERFFESRPAESYNFKEVSYKKENFIGYVTINREFNYNAYSTTCLQELKQAFTDASFDDKVAVVVFTGAGERAFCTGGDVKEYEKIYTKVPRDYWKYMCYFREYIESIINCSKPVIARLNGMAVGGGNESHLACDLSIMAEHSYIAQVGTNVGSVACGGSTQWLSIIVGDRRAREILFLNEKIDAYKALDWGLVTKVVPSVTKDGNFIEKATPDEIKKAQKKTDGYEINLSMLDKEVEKVCKKIINKFPECTRYTKTQVNFWKELAWHSTITHARDWLSVHYTSWEPIEGMGAFVEKRNPDYMKLRKLAAEGKSSEFVWGPYAKQCKECNAKNIPDEFQFCGVCGAKLD